MVSTKVVVGSLGGVAAIGTAGYLVTNSSTDEGNEWGNSLEQKTNKEKLIENKFELLNMDHITDKNGKDYEDWRHIVEYTKGTTVTEEKEIIHQIKQIQGDCKNLLEKNFTNTEQTDKYQETINKCTKSKTVKERAQKFEMVPLKTATTGDTDEAAFTQKLKDHETKIQEFKSWQEAAQWCQQHETDTRFSSGFNQDFWTRYLRTCMKENAPTQEKYKEELILSYWTRMKLKNFKGEDLTA